MASSAKFKIRGLVLACENKPCDWTGTIQQFITQHGVVCIYKTVSCTLCNAKTVQKDLANHMPVCPDRLMPYVYCKTEIKQKDMENHVLNVCLEVLNSCKFCGHVRVGICYQNHQQYQIKDLQHFITFSLLYLRLVRHVQANQHKIYDLVALNYPYDS